jgi:hypothetical protein
MKKILILLASLLLLSCETSPPTSPTGPSVKTGEILLNISFNIDAGLNVSKKVLLEDFANVSCAPCVISNRIIESLVKETYGTEKLIFVKFPTNFPSAVDPFYLAAKNECDFRMSFYNIFFAPTVIIDGLTRPVPTDSNSIKQAIDGRLIIPAPFNMNIAKQIQGGGLVVDLSITAKDTISFNYSDLVLHFALVESEIEFATPPGSNGETIFHNVLRLQLPGTQGYDLNEIKSSGTAGLSINYEETIDELWDITKLHPVVFIQNKLTKEVYQAGSTF